MNPTFTVEDMNQILMELDNLPHRFARPVIDKIQAMYAEKTKEVQTNGATNPQVQDTINEVEANQD